MNIIFDMDGTLFHTEPVLRHALARTFDRLREEQLWQGNTPIDTYLTILGAPMETVWKALLPTAAPSTRELADHSFWTFLIEEIHRGNGELYPSVIETLERLHRAGHQLYIASNGFMRYLEAIVQHFDIVSFFKDIYGADRFDDVSTKVELVERLKDEHRLTKGIMVGDRTSDFYAGLENGLLTVACTYGYGKEEEFSLAHNRIDALCDLHSIVQQVENGQLVL